MRAGHHSGLASFIQEDAIVCVSGGGIRDREFEHLAPADMAIAQMYRLLLKTARQAAAGGKLLTHGLSMADYRGTHSTIPVGTDWRTLVPGNLAKSKSVA